MYKTLFISSVVFFILCLNSCDKKEVSPIAGEPVVLGYVYPGNDLIVSISGQATYDATTAQQGIAGLAVFVTNDSATFQMSSTVSGVYYLSDTILKIRSGNTISLEFNYNQRSISATTIVPPKPDGFSLSTNKIYIPSATNIQQGGTFTFTPITITWTNPDKQYYFVVVESIDSNAALINPNRPTVRRFRSFPVQTNTTDVQPNAFSYYGQHRIILFRVNADYAALYNQSANNSQNITTPPTNVVNGFGIFTGVSSDSATVVVSP